MNGQSGELAPGQRVANRYVVGRVLGQGGYGIVYAAADAALERTVALKLLSPGRLTTPSTEARFQREVRIGAQLTSDHVVEVYDTGVDPVFGPFVVLELLEGEDLAELMRRHGPVPVELAARWILEACDAIGEAHALGVVHRDVKPSNLFLARNAGATRIKVLDFGIARIIDDPHALTVTGGTVGTPRYMSPEQLAARHDIDARSDIWSLGVTLYELVSGSPIFDAASGASFGALVLTAAPTSLRARMPSVPVGFEQLVHKCLQRDPDRRFPAIPHLAHALAEFAGEGALAVAQRISARVAARSATSAPGYAANPTPGSGSRASMAPGGTTAPTAATITAAPRLLSTEVPNPHTREAAPMPPPAIAPTRSHTATGVMFAMFAAAVLLSGATYGGYRAWQASHAPLETLRRPNAAAVAAPSANFDAHSLSSGIVRAGSGPAVPSPSATAPTPPSAAPSGTWCGEHGAMCHGNCENIWSDDQCGACDHHCKAGEHCLSNGGSYQCGVCPSGRTACANSCVDLSSNAMHCGRCLNSCGAKLGKVAHCVSGVCEAAY